MYTRHGITEDLGLVAKQLSPFCHVRLFYLALYDYSNDIVWQKNRAYRLY